MTPSKIEGVINIVLQTFCPHINTEKLELPKTVLATRMRSSELPTVNLAQEATMLSESPSHVLGSDGTTLNQKRCKDQEWEALQLALRQ